MDDMDNLDIQNNSPPKPKKISIFWMSFIFTLVVFATFYGYALYKKTQAVTEFKVENNKVVLSGKLAETVEQNFPAHLSKIEHEFTIVSVRTLNPVIDQELDKAFETVYQQIPEYLNFHYSLKGEYTEIVNTLNAKSEQETERILFVNARFNDALQQALGNIQNSAAITLSSAVQNVDTHAKSKLGLTDSQVSLLGELLDLSTSRLQQRLASNFKKMLTVGAEKLGIMGASKIAAKSISKKVGTKLLAKLSLKAGAKAGGIGSGAAAGASIGKIGGPIGAAVGGVVGAALAWVATDKIILEADKYLNQDEFRADVTELVNVQKQEAKAALKVAYSELFNNLAISQKQALKDGVIARPTTNK